MDDSQTKRYVEEIERIIRAHNPAFDELYTTLDRLKHLCDLTKQAEQKPSLTFQEKLVLKRMDELIRIQLDDMGWKYQHSSIYGQSWSWGPPQMDWPPLVGRN